VQGHDQELNGEQDFGRYALLHLTICLQSEEIFKQIPLSILVESGISTSTQRYLRRRLPQVISSYRALVNACAQVSIVTAG
jgi:hypothetical protein